MWAVGLIVGALLGAIGDHDTGIFAGALIGLVLGLFAGQWKKALVERLSKLEARVEVLARAVAVEGRGVAAARQPLCLRRRSLLRTSNRLPAADAMPADTLARTEAERLPALGRCKRRGAAAVRKGGVGAPPRPTAMTGEGAPRRLRARRVSRRNHSGRPGSLAATRWPGSASCCSSSASASWSSTQRSTCAFRSSSASAPSRSAASRCFRSAGGCGCGARVTR
jgi:hypothetical protein